MIDWTKPIETTAGVEARVLATDITVKGGNNIVAALYDGDDVWKVFSSTPDGRVCGYQGEPTGLQLRNKPVKREGWMNVYPGHGPAAYMAYGGEIWASREVADAMAERVPGRVACIRVEWEAAP